MKNKYKIIIQVLLLIIIKIVISNIFIIGVDQKGINKEVLDKISTKTYDELSLLMIEEDFSYFDKCYKYDENNDIYVLEKNDKELKIISSKILPLHYLIYDIKQGNNENIIKISKYDNVYNILKGSSENQRKKYLKDSKERINKLSEKTKKKLIIKDISLDYKRQGIDLDKNKNNYINKNIMLLLILSFLFTVLSINKETDNKENKLLYLVSILILLGTNKYITLILAIIYLLVLGIIYLLNKQRLKKEKLDKRLIKIEDNIVLNKIKITKLLNIYLFILLFINPIIIKRYTSYHIFASVKGENLSNNLLFIEFGIYNILIFIEIIINIILIIKLNRKEEKNNKKNKKGLSKKR